MAAMVACASLALAGTAFAETETVWSAVLTQPDADLVGCDNDIAGSECSSASVLTDDDFTAAGVDYEVVSLTVNGTLALELNKEIPAEFRSAWVLNVNGTAFSFEDASNGPDHPNLVTWNGVSLAWNAGAAVAVSLASPPSDGEDSEYRVWSGTLSLHRDLDTRGCWYPKCVNYLTPHTFTYDGKSYSVDSILLSLKKNLYFRLNDTIQDATLRIDETHEYFSHPVIVGKSFDLRHDDTHQSWYRTGLDWPLFGTVDLSLWASQKPETNQGQVPANSPPAGADKAITIQVNATHAFAASDFGFSDPDAGDSLAKVQITALQSAGSLKLGGTQVTLNQEVAASAIPTLAFEPAPGASGSPYATFQFKVSDGAAYASQANTITVNVQPPQSAPPGGDQPQQPLQTPGETPVITLAGSSQMTVQVGSAYAEPGYAATDTEDGNLTSRVVVTGTVDTTTTGTYTLQYDVSDSSGNAAVTRRPGRFGSSTRPRRSSPSRAPLP